MITSLMLVCAVAASLALGVLVAYGVCQAMFRLFRGPYASRKALMLETQPSAVPVAIEG